MLCTLCSMRQAFFPRVLITAVLRLQIGFCFLSESEPRRWMQCLRARRVLIHHLQKTTTMTFFHPLKTLYDWLGSDHRVENANKLLI